MKSVAQRVAVAKSYVGNRTMSGWCEMFVRTCFGFPAKYGSALQAWNATKRRHSNINDAPAGVPIFWRLHKANPNYGLGHVAISVGGGYCISTSVGANKSIGKVRIADLTRAWGMTPLGWTEDYHGKTVWTPPAPAPAPKPGKAPRQGRPPGLPQDFILVANGLFGFHTVWALQKKLRDAGYKKLKLDGDFGPVSCLEYQHFLRHRGFYKGALDGDFGRVSRIAEQQWLRRLGYLGHAIDGHRLAATVTSLQHALLDGKVQ